MRKVPQNIINNKLIDQLIRSACSIGANYMEATESESKKDFIHKIGVCKKEVKETQYWIRLLAKINLIFKNELLVLWKENHELLLIFSKILSTSRNNMKKI